MITSLPNQAAPSSILIYFTNDYKAEAALIYTSRKSREMKHEILPNMSNPKVFRVMGGPDPKSLCLVFKYLFVKDLFSIGLLTSVSNSLSSINCYEVGVALWYRSIF